MQVVRDIINNYKTGYVKSVNVEFQDGYFTSYDMKDTATISTASTIHGWITGCVVSGSTNEDKKGFGIFVLSLFCLFVLAWIYGEIKNRFFPDPPMPYNKRAF
jgi:uncharacterized membrane protein YoaK (UPF0700 family)